MDDALKKTKARNASIKKKYGLSPEDYDLLLAYQKGGCAICGKPQPLPGEGNRHAVEHDHRSGAVRSLACFRCNKFRIGRNTLEIVEQLVEYFKNPPADKAFGGRRFVPPKIKKKRRKRK